MLRKKKAGKERITPQSLREAEDRWKFALEGSGNGVWDWDIQKKMAFFSATWKSMLGYEEDEIGESETEWSERLHPDDADRVFAIVQEHLSGKTEGFSAEMRMKCKDGSYRHILSRGKVIKRSSDGSPLRMIGIHTDITSPREIEERYRALFLNIPIGVAVYEAVEDGDDFIFQDFNPGGEKIERIKRKDVIGRRITEAFPGVEEFGLLDVLRRVWKTGKSEYFPSAIYQDDRLVDAWRENWVYKLPDGLVVAVYHDISGKKKAEEEMRRLARFPEENPHPVLRVSLKGKLLYANPASSALLESWGCRTGDVIPEHWHKLAVEAISAGCPSEAEAQFGAHIFCLTITPIPGETYLNIYGRDITGRRQAEAEKWKLDKQLRHSQKMEAVGQLAGGIAHDFNNILQAIMGYGEMVKMELEPDSRAGEGLDEILKAAERAAALVSQLLLFSRNNSFSAHPLNLNKTVVNLLKMLQYLLGERIYLTTQFGGVISPILADEGQIEQLLMNLCLNARDALPDGGKISISTENVNLNRTFRQSHPDLGDGDYILLSISDTGTGIPPEILEHIFEPFFTTKDIGSGTGLGLATVYAIIKRHAGVIEVDSQLGEGTTFRVYLPALDGEVATGQEIGAGEEVTGGDETILLAEDDSQINTLTTAILKNAGYRVITTMDGEEAIRKFTENRGEIDLAIIDAVMPKQNGKAVFEKLRAKQPSLPIIFITGYIERTLGPFFDPSKKLTIIKKPFNSNELLSRVREALDGLL
jgi:PAS domain S-box-containing protein